MASREKNFSVDVERDEDGRWVGTVRGLNGVHSQARTIETLFERIKEAIRAAGVAADRVSLMFIYPQTINSPVKEAAEARDMARLATEAAQKKMAAAVVRLKKMGLSVRDVAELLGNISYQRVQQIFEASK